MRFYLHGRRSNTHTHTNARFLRGSSEVKSFLPCPLSLSLSILPLPPSLSPSPLPFSKQTTVPPQGWYLTFRRDRRDYQIPYVTPQKLQIIHLYCNKSNLLTNADAARKYNNYQRCGKGMQTPRFHGTSLNTETFLVLSLVLNKTEFPNLPIWIISVRRLIQE